MLKFALLAMLQQAPLIDFPNEGSTKDLNDYPEWALKEGRSAGVVTRLTTDPAGRITDCLLLEFVGDKKLANEMCKIQKRKKREPARLADGTPVAASFRFSYRYFQPESAQGKLVMGQYPPTPDLDVTISRMPWNDGADTRLLRILYDAGGTMTDCSIGAGGEIEKRLEQAVCIQAKQHADQIRAQAKIAPGRFAVGMLVRFTTGSSTK